MMKRSTNIINQSLQKADVSCETKIKAQSKNRAFILPFAFLTAVSNGVFFAPKLYEDN